MTDPIADFFTRIRNSYLAHQRKVQIPYSKQKHELAKILKSEAYIKTVELKKSPLGHRQLLITLNYFNKLPAISGIKRLSKPGRRLYVRSGKISPVLAGQGISIISTSQGLLTNKQAKKKNLGGELICKVW